MELPQSKTDDCLIALEESIKDSKIPPKPPYPRSLTKNGIYRAQQQQTSNSQPNLPQSSDIAVSSNSVISLQPTTFKVVSNCSSNNTEITCKFSAFSRRPSGMSFMGYKYNQAVVEDSSAGCFLRVCFRGWMTFLQLLIALRAILVRFVFLALTLSLVIMVVMDKKENLYWLLCFLMLPLMADLCYSIRLVIMPKVAFDKTEKWFTKCLLAYLLCACPPIWITELHHLQQLNDYTEAVINSPGLLDSNMVKNPWEEAGLIYNEPGENLVIMGDSVENYLNAVASRENITASTSVKNSRIRIKRNVDEDFQLPTNHGSIIQAVTLQNYPPKMRIRMMEQLLLLTVIVGRFLLPRFGITRDQLSQLLLINIGNAADILELFEAFNEEAVRMNSSLKISILCLWQASLFQFCFNKTAVLENKKSTHSSVPVQAHSMSRSTTLNDSVVVEMPQIMDDDQHPIPKRRHFCACCPVDPSDDEVSGCGQLWFGTEIWAIFMSLILQDVPFLALRLTLIILFKVNSYSNIFFTCKNSLLILLQIFRSVVIINDFRRNWKTPKPDIPMIVLA
nr:transmembrane protein 26 [Hymenolepis microstoma]